MNLIKSHKIATATILVGIIGSAAGIAVISQPVDNQVRHVSEMVAEKTKETEPIAEVSTEASTESSQEILTENTPEPAPIVVEEVKPPTVADEDMYYVIMDTIYESGFERWITITNIGVLNMLQHHVYGSDIRYTKTELKTMTNKCLKFIEGNKQIYLDKYGSLASKHMALDARNTPCWLI